MGEGIEKGEEGRGKMRSGMVCIREGAWSSRFTEKNCIIEPRSRFEWRRR